MKLDFSKSLDKEEHNKDKSGCRKWCNITKGDSTPIGA